MEIIEERPSTKKILFNERPRQAKVQQINLSATPVILKLAFCNTFLIQVLKDADNSSVSYVQLPSIWH